MMGLKSFHVFFVVLSIILAVGVGMWVLAQDTASVGWAILAFASAVGLSFYLRSVLKKFKEAHIE